MFVQCEPKITYCICLYNVNQKFDYQLYMSAVGFYYFMLSHKISICCFSLHTNLPKGYVIPGYVDVKQSWETG